MAVVTLSRQLGSGGDKIATLVAEVLALRLVDAATIDNAALKAGVPQVALAEMEQEGERGLADQVLKALSTMPTLPGTLASAPWSPSEPSTSRPELSGLTIPFAGLFSPTAPPISASMETYVRMVGLVVRGVAREGQVLIVGRAGQVLLRRAPEALHVQVVAPLKQRIETVMAREGLTWRTAQSRVRASDRARADYLRRYHGVDWLDSTLYHLVINTGGVSVATAVDLIVAAQQATTQARTSLELPGSDLASQDRPATSAGQADFEDE